MTTIDDDLRTTASVKDMAVLRDLTRRRYLRLMRSFEREWALNGKPDKEHYSLTLKSIDVAHKAAREEYFRMCREMGK